MSIDVGLLRADAVIIGGGLAGLWAALHLPAEWDVIVIDKGRGPDQGSSPWAQGGMAVAVGPDDSPSLHARDTFRAGADACHEDAVQALVDEAREALDELVLLGCAFDRAEDGSFDLNREGGQSVARSVHAADATGREIMRVVGAEARKRAQRIVGTASRLLLDDGRCAGVRVATDQGEVDVIGKATLLAVGGCGALYEQTTNPETATGDGIALAYQAGAEVADCEFVQFHPTALDSGGVRRVLLTEALRGEGAIVVNSSGKRFLLDAHPDGELAPRDVVARAIAAEVGGAFLDARPIGSAELRTRFPNILKAVTDAGFDLAGDVVPIAPAAHYFLGGVATDIWGRTTIPGLFAAGECAATGVHGANRMAGNSLTEAVVFGKRAAMTMTDEAEPTDVPVVDEEDAEPSVRAIGADDWARLRHAMSNGVGLVRTKRSLEQARRVLDDLAASSGSLRLSATAGSLICRSAIERDESRGVHFRSDHPEPMERWESRHVTLSNEEAR